MSQTVSPPAIKPKAKSKRHLLPSGKSTVILIAVLTVSIVGAILWWLHVSQYESTDNATLEGHVHPVSAKVGGTVMKVLVDDNQLIKQGQLLAVIDSEDYAVALSQAEHNLLNAQAQAKTAFSNIAYTQRQANSQMTQAQGNITASESGIIQSHQAVTEAGAAVKQARHMLQEKESSYQKALSDYNRYKAVDPEAISALQLDTAATALKNAQAERDAAHSSLEQTQARMAQTKSSVKNSVSKLTQSKGIVQSAQAQTLQVGVVKSQYASALAAVEVAKDEVRQAKLNLSYTRILAPSDGRVGRKSLEVGQRIQAGEPLLSVVSPDIWVVANYKETQLERMRPGQPVDVHVDAFPSHQFRGRVSSFSPASGAQFALLPAENATGNFTKIVQRIPVKILLDSKSIQGYETLLVPGMSTVVSVQVSKTGNHAHAAESSNNARIH